MTGRVAGPPGPHTGFRCLGCRRSLSADHVRGRIRNPPGTCPDCGHAVIEERRPGALAALAAAAGEPVGTIDVDLDTGDIRIRR